VHVHSHGAGSQSQVLKISLAVTLAYIVLLVGAGLRAHSLALLSEAGHNLSDFLALLLSLVAVYFQSRPANPSKTYGYQRAGVLAALVNAASLVAVSFFIFYEAFRRLQHPEHVQASVMMWVAAAGVVMNGVIALLLYRSGGDVNIRRLGDSGHRQLLDRLGSIGWNRRADSVVRLWHRSRDSEHSARRHAPRHEAGNGRVGDSRHRGRE